MGSIVIDHKYIKGELKKFNADPESYRYGSESDANASFDTCLVNKLERQNGLRIIDINQCGNNFNVSAYQRKGNVFTTTTIKVQDYRDHETTAKHVVAINELVGSRAKKGPENPNDYLTVAACNSITDKNGIYKKISTVNSLLSGMLR